MKRKDTDNWITPPKIYNELNTSVLLIPAQTGTKLFHDIILPNAKEIRFRKGRIQFIKLDENGAAIKTKSGNPLDSMIIIF